MKYWFMAVFFILFIVGCEITDVMTATGAGIDVVKAIRYLKVIFVRSDQTIQKLGVKL